jgi:polyisoprenoid-binding protein YceI
MMAAVALATIAGAWRPLDSQQSLTLAPESRLWFDGKSTVKDWSCKAPVLQATVEVNVAAPAEALLAGQEPAAKSTFTVPTMRLDCDNGTMNGHMRKALDASKHGEITFTLSGYDLDTAAGIVQGTLRGELTIKGISRAIELPVEFVQEPAGGIRVKGKYTLKMTDWGVTPPKLMMGTLKVNEMVSVGFDLLLN